jgi:hypothetical protein
MTSSMVLFSLRYLCVISDLLDDHLLDAMLNQRVQLANSDTLSMSCLYLRFCATMIDGSKISKAEAKPNKW